MTNDIPQWQSCRLYVFSCLDLPTWYYLMPEGSSTAMSHARDSTRSNSLTSRAASRAIAAIWISRFTSSLWQSAQRRVAMNDKFARSSSPNRNETARLHVEQLTASVRHLLSREARDSSGSCRQAFRLSRSFPCALGRHIKQQRKFHSLKESILLIGLSRTNLRSVRQLTNR